MEKKVVLSLFENVGFTLPKVETEEFDMAISAKIINRKKALKKLIKLYSGHDILLSKISDRAEIFNEVKRKWDYFSPESVIPVINKICRQVSLKFDCSIPFEEIYILAEQSLAISIIEEIKNLSRLFIVISPNEADIKLYDKLYFKHCAMARHLEKMPNTIKNDSMIICFEDYSLPLKCKSPFVNFTDKKAGVCNEINGKKIYVSNSNIKQMENLWGGNSGLSFLELFGIKTSSECIVDINNCADDIFLLDIAQF
ncbi:MAG: hypothetical protein IJX50_04755 [Clostridia bacterium]|nr:hypothetical protein [Clostridia bacterium]